MSYQSILINTSVVSNIKENYNDQIQALILFYPVINNAIKGGVPVESIKFGGGTALSIYYYQHRLSFDIDLFILNPQYLSFFSPKLWIEDYDSFDQSQYIDKSNHIGVITSNNIKIDILVDPNSTSPLVDDSKEIFPFDIYIESIEDIIAKKIVFRKKDNKTRDIFDIALCISKNKYLLNELIKSEKILKDDLIQLKEALLSINIERYYSQLKIVEPIKKYENIANKSVEIILNNIQELKLLD